MGAVEPGAMALQLQPLVEFLEPDERPTAIFAAPHGNDDATESDRPLYGNGAFAALDLTQASLRSLLTDLRADGRSNGFPPSPGGNASGQWQLRPFAGEYEALLRVAPETEAPEAQRAPSSTAQQAASAATNGRPETRPSPSEPSSIDWTQQEVPGLTPWLQFVRSTDWSKTDLGPMSEWKSELRGHVMNMMANPNPRLMVWGTGMTFFYNEACVPIWGAKHPHCFARPIQEPWADIWDQIEPIIRAVYQGQVMQQYNLPLDIRREGYPEECYFNYTMIPLRGSEGHIEGVIDEIHETTAEVRWDRRRNTLLNYGERLSGATTLESLWLDSLQGLESAVDDVTFALLYAVVDAPNYPKDTTKGSKNVQACVLQGSVGISTGLPSILETFLLDDARSLANDVAKACAEACKNRVPIVLSTELGNMPEALRVGVPGRACGEQTRRVVITPVVSTSGNQILAVMVIALNPRSPFDESYSLYIDYLGDLLNKTASLISLPQAQKQAQQANEDANEALSAKLRLVTLQAERSEAKFARMAAEAPTGMFVYSGDGRPLYANDEYLRIVGSTREQYFDTARSLAVASEVVHEDDRERFRASYRQVMEQKTPVSIEYRLKKPWTTIDATSGQEMTADRWLLANAFPDIDYNGKLNSVQGWVTDISHRRFTEKLVSRRLEEALESKRLTENFIDMTSHEMRNPLSAMLQSADSIVTLISPANALRMGKSCSGQACTLDGEAAADILDAAQTIVLCAQHQKRIVDDILTLSKLDASLVVMCPENVRLPPLLDQALRMFEAEIARVDTETEVVVEPSYHELDVDWVVLDTSRLLQIIINLVTNSLKFIQGSERRKITLFLGASYEKPTGKHHGVSFVPRAAKESAQSPSTGWGDGEDIYMQIAVTDTGRGLSEEELKLLFHRFSQGSPKTYKQYGGSGLGLYISRQLCELQGGQIGASSGQGKTIFTFYVRAKRGQPATGRESCEIEPWKHATAPHNSVSKGGRPPATPLVGNVNGMKTAPAQMEKLQNGDITQRPILLPRGSHLGAVDETDLHVLLVEDNKINQRITSQQLRKAGGHIVHVADHGEECLDFLARTTFCSQQTQLHIILLDLEMPVMDGWTCAREIRQRQREGRIARHVPIIAVTANARPEQIASAMEAGADAVVTKPFRTSDLIPRIREVVDKVARGGAEG